MDAATDRWAGAVEGLHDGLLYGWAVDTANADARVVLELRLNGDAVGSTVADVVRNDLGARLQALLGAGCDPCHGFVADLGALGDRLDGILTAHVANVGWTLPGAIDRTAAPAVPPAALNQVYGDGGLRLQGWAPPPFPGASVQVVRAWLGGRLLAEARAGQALAVLRGRAAERDGFQLDLPPDLADGRRHAVHVVDQDGNALNGSPVTVCCFLRGAGALAAGAAQLLPAVIDHYERHLPRSLGMTHYPAWSAAFEAPADPLPPAAALRVGIVVHGRAGMVADRTIASLDAQTWPPARVAVVAEGGAFDAALRTLLDAGCEAIGCVRAGDTLVPHALARALDGFALAGARLVYTDSEAAGRPWFKPAWSPDYALASDYPLELMLVRAQAVRDARAQAPAAAGAAQFCWGVLAHLWTDAAAIVHVPRVLYRFDAPLDAAERQARYAAAAAALARIDPRAGLLPLEEAPADAGFLARRPHYPLAPADRQRRVTLIIPTRDRVDLLQRCIDSIGRHTAWDGLDILVVDNGSALPASRDYLAGLERRGIGVLRRPGPFNYAALNNDAVAHARGEIVGLLNNDIEALHDGWLDAMVGELLRPGTGAVGAKLVWPNGMVQHGGVVLGVDNLAGHFGNNLADADWGDHGRNQLPCEVSAVTAACLLVRKRDYLDVGGMDERAFPVAFNDVDLCLKLRTAGKTIVWTPAARLLHAESASRGREDTPQKRSRALREIELIRQRWGELLLRDPAYHPSLNLDAQSCAFGGLAFPPRPRVPRRAHWEPTER